MATDTSTTVDGLTPSEPVGNDTNLQPLRFTGRVLVLDALAAWITRWVLAPETLADKYDFAPMSTLVYSIFGVLQFLVATGSLIAVFVAWNTKLAANGSRLLMRLCAVAGAMLLVSNWAANADKRRIAAQEDRFALQFNELYCNTRTLQVCMDGHDPAVLKRLVTGDKNATSSSIKDAPIWFHCRALVTIPITKLRGKYIVYSSDVEIVANPKRAFLKASNATDTGDLWCGNMLVFQNNSTESPLVATNIDLQPLLGSPYEANKRMFDDFQNEWLTRTTHENHYVAISVVIMALLGFVLVKIDRLTHSEEAIGKSSPLEVTKQKTRHGGGGIAIRIDLNEEATRLAPLTPITVGPTAL